MQTERKQIAAADAARARALPLLRARDIATVYLRVIRNIKSFTADSLVILRDCFMLFSIVWVIQKGLGKPCHLLG